MRISMDYMRQQIASVYGPLFVSDMPPRQVAAVYKNMKARGKFDPVKESDEPAYRQMTIFDWICETKGEIELWETR